MEVTFLPDTRKQEIFNALISGQKKVTVDNVEIILPTLKRDTLKNKEREADKISQELFNVLQS